MGAGANWRVALQLLGRADADAVAQGSPRPSASDHHAIRATVEHLGRNRSWSPSPVSTIFARSADHDGRDQWIASSSTAIVTIARTEKRVLEFMSRRDTSLGTMSRSTRSR